jgi:TetR/AcrR family transcriptional repressor of nem operon
MARTREFDLSTTLDQAMRVFWRKGYAATSMSDIYAATGLKPGSVYAAFKDKEGLFQQVFDHYAGFFRATLPTDSQGVAAIRAWIVLQARLASEDKDRAGCLIVNTVAEREAHSPATQAMARGRMREIRDFFVRHLMIAVQAGELARDTDIDLRADALVGAVVSIMTLGRAGADTATIRHVADAALEPFAEK